MKQRLFGLISPIISQTLISGLFLISLLLMMPTSAQQIENKTIKPEPMVKEISRTGKLDFKRTLNMSFKSSGYLEKLNVDEGERFVKGQLLAQLENEEVTAEKNAT